MASDNITDIKKYRINQKGFHKYIHGKYLRNQDII